MYCFVFNFNDRKNKPAPTVGEALKKIKKITAE